MPAGFAKISISVTCDLRVGFSDRFNINLSYFKKLIDAAAGYWITACINHNCCFDIITRTDGSRPNLASVLQEAQKIRVFTPVREPSGESRLKTILSTEIMCGKNGQY